MPAPLLLRAPPRLDPESQDAWSRLAQLRTEGACRAAVLALLMTPDSDRERRAWADATRGVEANTLVRGWTRQLPPEARLPALAMLLRPCAGEPLEQRQALLQSLRRMMCADGQIGPLDRLAWLVVRHRLAGPTRPHRGGMREHNELEHLPLALRQAIAQFTAYLARMVPEGAPDVAGVLVGAAGTTWYDTVMRGVWGAEAHPPTCHVPDVDGLGRALQTLQALGWMHRPVLARLWTDAATTRPGLLVHAGEGLPVAAEALWLACALLDTPQPPALSCHFIQTEMASGQELQAGGT
ncbi:hypothetical protein [Sphaerotilus montanus]|jgi:hypothetical protein|uniref:Uncharacterized protein n=1 Tax=Sphaerotilus montanus TaxID=522889 RepID=A0A7Y9QZ13_9BURK|nr:hypothetical protein [Sphaerotilus montanus]NYG33244.1 hypothetical protein [Sphaerotilus montanus]